MKFPLLFSRGAIGTLKTKNRLVMPPMVRNYANADGTVSQRYVDHIKSIAAGGVGTLILEASFVRPEGRGFVNELGIHTDAMIPGLKKIVQAAHAHGAVIGPQLYHAGRQTTSKTSGFQPVAPSPIPDVLMQEMPHELTIAEIKDLIHTYAEAAVRAKKAGFDFVELHGAHGYLIQQFLSPFSNKRTDEYGGSKENREKFLFEVFAAVRAEVGEQFPITVRLSGDEMIAGGLKIADMVAIAKKLEHAGVDALHISVGNYATYAKGFMIPPMAAPDGALLPLAAAISKAVKIPVIAVGKIRTPEMAEKVLKTNGAAFIAIGRTLLADPQWPNKVRAGKLDEINPCIACNQGCISRLFAQKDVRCTVNPACGREKLFEKKRGAAKKVLVIGAGPAGLEAAKIATERGHRVTLIERSNKIGGQLNVAMIAPYRQGWKELLANFKKIVTRKKIDIRLNTPASIELVKKLKPDAIIYAAGSTPNIPEIPGIQLPHVFNIREALTKPTKIKGAIVIAGGGCSGAQAAEFFAIRGHKVSIVEMTNDIALSAPLDERMMLLERLKKLKVQMMTNTKIQTIENKKINISDASGTKTISADTVVICFGSQPEQTLYNELRPLVKKIIRVGDAQSARQVTEAISEGALAALSL
ncbi:MAG: FAD-dependent oxidoreductase [Candidatus Magasanikbacteria bacterium]|nr:FAD-dependent oxidoreductase [Candidatus Magasanikbacteria bacterium]